MIYKRTMYKSRTSGARNGYMQSRSDCGYTDSARYSSDTARDVDVCVSGCAENPYPSLAMVYGASQCWRGICDGDEGFERGTIFNELDKPFMGDKCKNGGYCK